MALDILLVDDEPGVRLAVADRLRAAGHTVSTARDGTTAVRVLDEQTFDLLICDILLPGLDGTEVFRRARKTAPDTDVILITGHGTVDEAVSALKEGATDYLTKPFEPDVLVHEVDRIAERRELQAQLTEARRELAERRPGTMIGSSQAMRRVLDRVETIAPTEAAVLIQGESGTGKELVARTLHDGSPRRQGPFVAVNCAAFPDTLIEAELFGHERGAFTGAVRRRQGRFKTADGGTLFLDEVAELPLPAQAKLLRVLQEGCFEPLGSDAAIAVDVRVISATHRDLRARVADGRFREDLFYRLKVIDVRIPPLRSRREDIPILVEHFLARFSDAAEPPTLSARAWASLSQYPFPGNVRELQHAVHHAVVLARGGNIDLHHLPEEIAGSDENGDDDDGAMRPLAVALREFEREYLARALAATAGNRAQAAQLLGISRKNLWEKLVKLGMGRPRDGEAPTIEAPADEAGLRDATRQGG